VSGDYSAATDGLNLWYTKGAFEESLNRSGLSGTDQSLLRSVLYEQTISYPDEMVKKSKGLLSPFLQRNGQLMGSTLSFPILCTINLVCYWKALERYTGRTLKPDTLPVLVNGDDILFRADERLYALWNEEIAKVGFTLSLGKNYVHPRILTVNSQTYLFEKDRTFEHLSYLNTGLLTGQSKLTGRSNAKNAPVWALYNEIIPNAVRPGRAHRRFLHYNKDLVSHSNNRGEFNLFLPVSRGGMGFTLTRDVKLKITSFQRRWASFMEKEVRESINKDEIPRNFGLGLVQERGSYTDPLYLKYSPTLTLEPIVGPLNRGVVPFQKKEFKFPILARPYDFDTPKLSFRLPRKSIKILFRNSYHQTLSTKKLLEPLPRICSIQQLTALVESDSESPPPL
jgi:hypothetical protein